MTWNYNPADATTVPKDYVRLLVGDTVISDPLLQDEEIISILADEGNSPIRAACTAADVIAGLYSRRVSEGGRQMETLAKHYMDLAARLRRKMARTGAAPFVGGQSQAAKAAQNALADRVPPYFARDEFSEPGTEATQTGSQLSPPVY